MNCQRKGHPLTEVRQHAYIHSPNWVSPSQSLYISVNAKRLLPQDFFLLDSDLLYLLAIRLDPMGHSNSFVFFLVLYWTKNLLEAMASGRMEHAKRKNVGNESHPWSTAPSFTLTKYCVTLCDIVTYKAAACILNLLSPALQGQLAFVTDSISAFASDTWSCFSFPVHVETLTPY